MKTQKPSKRIPRKEEYSDYDDFPKKSKMKKPKRGRKDFFYDEDPYDDEEDRYYDRY
ncbi:MAG: hypothetical protein Kow0029_24620 [Candidatus Rifleibacteriota bacterium]